MQKQVELWLAPLAGVTDFAYREICKSWGTDIMVSEMVSADGLHYSPQNSLPYANFSEGQRPFAIQLFGSEPQMMARGAQIVSKLKPEIIDINMGCPVKKVVKRGAGCALMREPSKAAAIVEAVKQECVKEKITLAVKFRAGWDKDKINAVEFALKMEESGADILTLHPRTRSQMFSGKSNWDLIRQVKREIRVPVIGNGDIFSVQDAASMLAQTGCDGLMIGRGILGKPWFIKQIKIYLASGEIWHPEAEEIINTIEEHWQKKFEQMDKERALLEMRPHLSAYTKGYSGSAAVRNLINNSTEWRVIFGAMQRLIRGSVIS